MVGYDESQVLGFIDDEIDAFANAGRIQKPVPPELRELLHGLVFPARMIYDVCNGWTYAASRVKHLAEVNVALNAKPAPTPAPQPTVLLTVDNARAIVFNVADAYPQLTAVFDSDEAAIDAATELLGRVIWHLQQAGFKAGKQRNPSKAISGDKVTIFADGALRIYDIFSLGYKGRATTVQFVELTGANPVDDPGIPD